MDSPFRHLQGPLRDLAPGPLPAQAGPPGRRRALRRLVAAGAAGAAVLGPGRALPAREVLRYGGDAALAPLESLDANGRPQGFQVDLLALLGRELGAEIRVELRPWDQTEAAFKAGALDLVALQASPQHQPWARFALGHVLPALGLYQPRVDDDPPDLASLAQRRVAVLQAPDLLEAVQALLAGVPAQLTLFAGAAEALAVLQRGGLDLALLPRAHADPVLAHREVPGVRSSRMQLQPQPYALAVPPAQDLLLGRVQRALHALERSGELAALRRRWLGSAEQAARLQRLPAGRQGAAGAWATPAGGAVLAAGLALGVAGAGWLGWKTWQQRRAAPLQAAAPEPGSAPAAPPPAQR